LQSSHDRANTPFKFVLITRRQARTNLMFQITMLALMEN